MRFSIFLIGFFVAVSAYGVGWEVYTESGFQKVAHVVEVEMASRTLRVKALETLDGPTIDIENVTRLVNKNQLPSKPTPLPQPAARTNSNNSSQGGSQDCIATLETVKDNLRNPRRLSSDFAGTSGIKADFFESRTLSNGGTAWNSKSYRDDPLKPNYEIIGDKCVEQGTVLVGIVKDDQSTAVKAMLAMMLLARSMGIEKELAGPMITEMIQGMANHGKYEKSFGKFDCTIINIQGLVTFTIEFQ